MRLSSAQVEAIKQETEHFFGAQAEVWLFGSRVDDTAKGGDVDLYVRSASGDADELVASFCVSCASQAPYRRSQNRSGVAARGWRGVAYL